MKAALPLAVLVAYLLTYLSFGSDGGGPLALWLPLLAVANFDNLMHGMAANVAAIIGAASGFGGLIALLGYACGMWRNRGASIAACGAMLISIAAFASGVPSPISTAGTAVPFVILSLLLLRREFTALRQGSPKA
jgi:hypothetical protein